MKKNKIAELVGASPSTISRELRRNTGRNGRYNWETARKNAERNRHRTPGNHAVPQQTKDEAVRLLREEQWSPEQISAVLRQQNMRISHETVYQMIRRDKRQGGDLYKNCPHSLKHRARPVGGRLSSIPNRVGIDQRPKEVDGKRFGDFEMDTIVGRNNHGAIVTPASWTKASNNIVKLARQKANLNDEIADVFDKDVNLAPSNVTRREQLDAVGLAIGVDTPIYNNYADFINFNKNFPPDTVDNN